MTDVELLSVADVARITGLSEYTVRAAVRDGELKASKLRGRIRVHPDDLAEWVDEGRVRPAGASLERGDEVVPPRRLRPAPKGGYRQTTRRRRAA